MSTGSNGYFLKRPIDFIVSLTGLILLSPVFVAIALIIAIDSRGPVFYMQPRIGKGRRSFLLFKFRTMYTGTESKGLITVGDHDLRVTRVGFYLRKYKLDELPQLINVLKGDMSLVGPRPEVQKYVDIYSTEQLSVLSVRPGITCPASIRYRNENEMLAHFSDPEDFYIQTILQEKLASDLEYIQQVSLKNDLKIIWQTFRAIIH